MRVAIEMVDVVTRISADNEREKNPGISELELISRLRRKFELDRRSHIFLQEHSYHSNVAESKVKNRARPKVPADLRS